MKIVSSVGLEILKLLGADFYQMAKAIFKLESLDFLLFVFLTSPFSQNWLLVSVEMF